MSTQDVRPNHRRHGGRGTRRLQAWHQPGRDTGSQDPLLPGRSRVHRNLLDRAEIGKSPDESFVEEHGKFEKRMFIVVYCKAYKLCEILLGGMNVDRHIPRQRCSQEPISRKHSQCEKCPEMRMGARGEKRSQRSNESVVRGSMSQGTIPSPMNSSLPSFESRRITSLQQPLKELNEREEEVFHDPCTKR